MGWGLLNPFKGAKKVWHQPMTLLSPSISVMGNHLGSRVDPFLTAVHNKFSPDPTPTMPAPKIRPVLAQTASQRGFNLSTATLPSMYAQGYSPTQVRSSIATQGLYGGGVDDQSRDYYLKQLQEALAGGDTNLLPVESSYLSRLGLPSGDSQMSELLRILSH